MSSCTRERESSGQWAARTGRAASERRSYRQKFMISGGSQPAQADCSRLREGYILEGERREDQEVRRTERRGWELCGMGGADATIC